MMTLSTVVWIGVVTSPLVWAEIDIGETRRAADRNVMQREAVYEGTTEAARDAAISTGELGRLVDVPVKIGDRVKKGDVLARLDEQLQVSAVELAEYQTQMTGEIRTAEVTLATRENEWQTLQGLHAKKMAGPAELQRAELEWRLAQARLQVAKEQWQYRVEELNRFRIQLERRSVTAPFDGVVAEVPMHVGESISPNSPAVVRLMDVSTLYALINIPADELDGLSVGQGVNVYFRASRRSEPGRVETIAPFIEAQSLTVAVRVAIDNSHGLLKPGDRCTMRLKRKMLPLEQAKTPEPREGTRR
ncbi:MAG: efflux RND transporter periplasmic adaptor subunit [Planctomycetota bacterium]